MNQDPIVKELVKHEEKYNLFFWQGMNFLLKMGEFFQFSNLKKFENQNKWLWKKVNKGPTLD